MFGPQHFPHIVKYFDGLDAALSQRLLRRTAPDEPALTNELCALMDAETQRSENIPGFNIDHLNAALADCSDGLDFDVRIDTHPHNSAMEAYVSQSDFGLVLEYNNYILPNHNWVAAYLVQAKRLYRNSATNKYDNRSSFVATNVEQQNRLEVLEKVLGSGSLLYCLYCPPTSGFSELAQTQIRALHTANLSGHIFDYAVGQALKDWLVTSQGLVDAGIWLAPITEKPKNIASLHASAFVQNWPLTWFFLDHFSSSGRLRLLKMDKFNTTAQSVQVRGIVQGDARAIQSLLSQLNQMDSGERSVPDRLKVLPRHTITIKVSVGRALPPDFVRLSID